MVSRAPADGDSDADGLQQLLDKGTLAVIGVLLLFAPAVLMVVTLVFLQLVHGLAIGELSPLELVELYLIEVALLAAFAYAIVRILRYSTRHSLPTTLDSLDRRAAGDDEPEDRD